MKILILTCSILFCLTASTQTKDSTEIIIGPDSLKREVVQFFKSYSSLDDFSIEMDKALVNEKLKKAHEIVNKFMKVDEVTATGILVSKDEPTRYNISYYRTFKTPTGQFRSERGKIFWE